MSLPYLLFQDFFLENSLHDRWNQPLFKYASLGGLTLYFCKDCIRGRSLAKQALKLQVVDVKNGLAATPLQCLLRNITIIVWPVEVIVAYFNTERRLGDRLAGTKIIYFDPAAEVQPINFPQVLASFIMGYGISFMTSIPL